jgi:hypothetical protein
MRGRGYQSENDFRDDGRRAFTSNDELREVVAGDILENPSTRVDDLA